MKTQKIAIVAVIAGTLLSFAAWAAVPSQWWAQTDLECVGDGTASQCDGALETGWDASLDIDFDPLSRTYAAGDDVGNMALRLTSKLYGDFTGTGKLYLTGAAALGCDGAWAAAFSGARLTSVDGWDGIGADKWSWKVDGTYYCLQDNPASHPAPVSLMPGRRIFVNVVPSTQLGALWGLTGATVVDPTPSAALSLRWSGVAVVNETAFDSGKWTAAVNQQASPAGATAYMEVGQGSIADLRNRVRKNIASITRGLTSYSGAAPTVNDLTTAWLASNAPVAWNPVQEILYYDFSGQSSGTCVDGNCGKTVTLNGNTPFGPSSAFRRAVLDGRKTLIIKGGNLRITADMAYAAADSLAAIVVLRDEENPKNGGNVYVDPKVTNLVGTFVLDGSMLNFDGTNVLSSNDSLQVPSLRRQMYVYGSLASSNTVGGSESGALSCPYGSDAEKNGVSCVSDPVRAAKYDLAAMRRLYIGSSYSTGVTVVATAQELLCRSAAAPGREILRTSSDPAKWDVQDYGWAGKRQCYLDDGKNPVDPKEIPYVMSPSLRTPTDAALRASVGFEYNPLAISDPLPIMAE